MKEYRCTVVTNGHTYFGSTLGVFTNKDHAEQVMLSGENAWHAKGSPDRMPDGFRLVWREVSEWRAEG